MTSGNDTVMVPSLVRLQTWSLTPVPACVVNVSTTLRFFHDTKATFAALPFVGLRNVNWCLTVKPLGLSLTDFSEVRARVGIQLTINVPVQCRPIFVTDFSKLMLVYYRSTKTAQLFFMMCSSALLKRDLLSIDLSQLK